MPHDPTDPAATPAPPNQNAPPDPGGAYDDIELVASGVPWDKDDAGYPHAEESDDDVDPGRLPESEGMAEDEPAPTTADDGLPAVQRAPEARAGGDKKISLPGFDELGTHLDELRRRLFISLAAFVPFFALGLWLYQDLWMLIIRPLERADPYFDGFQALAPSDGLIMAMRIAFSFALFLSLPVWLSQAWHFVAPGLTAKERRCLYLALGSGTVLFFLGVAMAYFFGIPFALDYLMPFNQSLDGWKNSFTGEGYVGFILTCCGGFGIAFELPLVMLALAWAGILTPEFLREWWRVVVLLIFILAAVMTPPDPFTQIMLAVPMLALFFVGYWLVKWAQPRK